MDKPIVSIIVAAYNVENYLSECLESILAQDFNSFELIVVDDASTDSTASILDSYMKKDQRIHVIHHNRNSGLSAVRNTGMNYAKGKYILFVDGDDLIASNLLSETVSCAEKQQLDEVSFGYKVFSDEQGWKWKEKKMHGQAYLPNAVLNGRQVLVVHERMREDAKGCLASRASWASWASLYKRSFLEKNNLYFMEGILHEDVLFWFQCCLCAERVRMIGKELYFYRQNSESITKSWKGIRAKSLFTVFSIIYAEWINNRFSAEEHKAVGTVLMSIWSHYKKAELCGETEDVAINPSVDFAYKLLRGKISYKWGQLSKATIERLRRIANVLVYGAGVVAADVIEQLYKNKINIRGVIVSYREGNPEYFGGVPVKTLEEWGRVEDAAVIIGIAPKYSDDIKNRLRQYGYQLIFSVEKNEDV